jgi:hypothetical protein
LQIAPGRLVCDGIRVMRNQDRRTSAELRHRINELLARVSAAREEIVEAGLDAVHDSRAPDEAPPTGQFARRRTTGAPGASASARATHPDG